MALAAALGSAAWADGSLAAGEALALAAGVPLPPAAFSNSVRCARNSTSFARMAGSIAVVPEVPTAPGVAPERRRGR